MTSKRTLQRSSGTTGFQHLAPLAVGWWCKASIMLLGRQLQAATRWHSGFGTSRHRGPWCKGNGKDRQKLLLTCYKLEEHETEQPINSIAMLDSLRLDEAVEFAENPEPRCPCVLLLDTSGSMQGLALDALNQGLQTFRTDLIKDSLAARRVEVAIVTFNNDIRIEQDFVTADQFEPPILTAQGQTFMGSAIHKALDTIQARKAEYRANGIAYYRPWVFMITDGSPQGEGEDVVSKAAQRIRDEEVQKHVAFFAVGVENADMERLAEIVTRTPVKLKGLNFVEMFLWLSASMSAVSHSKLDDQVALPPPGWGTV